jgi:hypothetical protein
MTALRADNTRRPLILPRIKKGGGFKVLDTDRQSLAYVYGRETKADAVTANIAKLPKLLGKD